MFVVEVRFGGGDTELECVLLQRSYARIGVHETSHLILDGVKDMPCEIELVRGIGRRFRCMPHGGRIEVTSADLTWPGEYDGYARIVLGETEVFVTSVDPAVGALFLAVGEDCIGEGISQAIISESDSDGLFPAIQATTRPQIGLSLGRLSNTYIGRSRKCLFRLDDREVRPEHLLIKRTISGFVLEPQARNASSSVNGRNLVEGRAISGGDRIAIGSSTVMVFLENQNDMENLAEEMGDSFLAPDYQKPLMMLRKVSGPKSSPNAIPLRVGQSITVGRDPSHSMWIDAPHISRLHMKIEVKSNGYEITDYSTNGTRINGVLITTEKPVFFAHGNLDFALGSGVELNISSQDYHSSKDKKESSLGPKRLVATSSTSDKKEYPSTAFDHIGGTHDYIKVERDEFLSDTNVNVAVSLSAEGSFNDDELSDQIKPGSDNKISSLQEYQFKTMLQLNDVETNLQLDPSLTQAMEQYSYDSTNFSGIQRILPVFLCVIILVLVAIFIILARHIIY
ncbi:MAG TPA: FHA domain-containing protein [Oligoflexia bacterium]|nr:FHA domain-containing protein [Oligoflexia bacterium]HMP47089.1 FHA domain-containing protein [Oligoflexia bacterium]